MKKLEKTDGSNFLWNLYMKTEVMRTKENYSQREAIVSACTKTGISLYTKEDLYYECSY